MDIARELRLKARFVLAQIATTASRDGSGSMSMLLSVDDLPGAGWRQIDERRWRVGVSSERAEWAERARRARCVTVWRSFEQVGAGRWLWTQASPLVSEADAEASLIVLQAHKLKNPRAQVRVVEEGQVEPPAISRASKVLAFRQTTIGRDEEGIALYLAWAYRHVMSVLACSGTKGSWTWEDAVNLASIQGRHIDEVISDS
jgi:hypothetical protein